MKSKKTLLLSGAVALLLGAAPFASALMNATAQPAHAQDSTAPTQPHKGKHKNVLNLTADQKAKMKQIRRETREKIKDILTDDQKAQWQAARKNHQRPNLNLTDDQKARIKEIRQDADSKIDAILTPEQRQKRDELRQQWRQRHQQRQQQQQS
jgi:Spy/CpxP family protein refolding chaperone